VRKNFKYQKPGIIPLTIVNVRNRQNIGAHSRGNEKKPALKRTFFFDLFYIKFSFS